jgi:serine protease Do
MKAKVSIATLVVSVLVAVALGIFFTVSIDMTESVDAVEYYYHDDAPLVAPAAMMGLPDLTKIVEKVNTCVINIGTKKKAAQRRPYFRSPMPGRDPFFDDFFERFFEGGPMPREQQSLGSGFVINEQGHILTNRHVIAGADEITILTSKDKKFNATVVGEDEKTDIAVLKIEASGLPYCTLGNSASLKVGEWVIAMGNPFGLDSTVTVGVVSAKGRVIGAGPYDDFIQTDASINPGNSGGPLFDLNGRVVGVNTAIVASGQGIGFAIPINLAKELIPQLIATGKVTRGWLGVGIQDMSEDLAKSFGLKEAQGALVSNVFPDSPAAKGGLKTGDVIISYDGKEIKESHDLPTYVAHTKIDSTVPMEVLRDGKKKKLEVTIGRRQEEVASEADFPTEDSEALGITVRDLTKDERQELNLAPSEGGVAVSLIEPGSPASRSDLRPGDIILSINGKKVKRAEDYAKIVSKLQEGDVVRLFVKRGEMTIFFAFTK